MQFTTHMYEPLLDMAYYDALNDYSYDLLPMDSCYSPPIYQDSFFVQDYSSPLVMNDDYASVSSTPLYSTCSSFSPMDGFYQSPTMAITQLSVDSSSYASSIIYSPPCEDIQSPPPTVQEKKTSGGGKKRMTKSTRVKRNQVLAKPTKKQQEEEEGQFKCHHQGCGKIFKRCEHLKRHVKSIHDKIKDFKCNFPSCDKAFSRSDNLNQHLRTHRTESIGKKKND